MTKPQDNENVTVFTQADRKALTDTANSVQEIYDFIFGCPKSNKPSFVMLVERNTIFRKVATVILLTLTPIVAMIIYHLITQR
ncbi:hypothetical protein EH223_12515 [candidate division KSB1 bacterium]|nr:hypothetical protein [candidate division KSB1 bacterium]RQW02451.1 MAG: hypothetical protein EH223_12515 [candidate division KSB1 bacterium]